MSTSERESAHAAEPAHSHWGTEAVDLDKPDLPALKARFLVERMPTQGKVCEIGCGDGKLLRTIARRCPELELFGCDVRVPATAPDAYRFAKIEDGRLPYDDASLDVVLVFDVLEHVPDPDATAREAARVLKPGGRLVAFIPVEGESLSFYEMYRRTLGKDTYAITKEHIQAFTHEGLRALLERYFVLAEVRYAYHALGHFMDASFFAAARMKFVRNFWWKDNAYYNGPKKEQSAASALMNKLLVWGNAAAYAESTLLGRAKMGAAGVLVDARVRK